MRFSLLYIKYQAGEKRWQLVRKTYASIACFVTATLSSLSEGGLTAGIKAVPREKPLFNLNELTSSPIRKLRRRSHKNAA